MSKKQTKKLITPEIFHQAVIGSFVKLNPRYMMKNPVMFVVEVGCFITLLLSFLPGLFGDIATSNLRVYNIIVCVVLFVTVLFANFAESAAAWPAAHRRHRPRWTGPLPHSCPARWGRCRSG